MKRLLLLMALMAPLLAIAGGASTSANAQFDAANRFYEEGKFSEAAASYETIVKGGSASPALWFNLGNAYFKAGQMGRAIASYHQASELTPRDPDVRANLQFARNRIEGPTRKATRMENAFGKLSLNEWAIFCAVGFWITFGLLAVMQWRPTLRMTLRLPVVAVAGATVVLAICLFVALSSAPSGTSVVITAKETVVHNGPLDESPKAFTAHDGAEFKILDRKDDWLQVTDGGRNVGWLKRSEVAAL